MDCHGNLQPGHSVAVYLPLCVNTNIGYTIEEEKFPGLHDTRHNSEPCLMISPEFEAVLKLTDGVDDSAVLPDSDVRDLEAQGELYHLIDDLDLCLEDGDTPSESFLETFIDVPTDAETDTSPESFLETFIDVPIDTETDTSPESFLETFIDVPTDAEADTTAIPNIFQSCTDESDCAFEFGSSKCDIIPEQFTFLSSEYDDCGSSLPQRMSSTERCLTSTCKKKRRFSNISDGLNEVVSNCSKRRKLDSGSSYAYSSGVQYTDSSYLSSLDVFSQSYSAHSPLRPMSLRAW